MAELTDVLAFTLKWEGGYIHHSSDPGGATKYGISQRAFPDVNIKDLTLEQAVEFYRIHYWEAIQGDDRPFHEALALFDFAVHSGVRTALAFWAETQDADGLVAARLDFLTSLSTWEHFGKGWTRRINDLYRTINADRQEREAHPDVELIQLYFQDRTYNFHPVKTSVGPTSSGRTKIMARLA